MSKDRNKLIKIIEDSLPALYPLGLINSLRQNADMLESTLECPQKP